MSMTQAQMRAASSMTVLDRFIGAVSPKWGHERLKARIMLSAATGQGGFKGGRRDRRGTRFWRPAEASANADSLPDLPDLRARARDLARNVPIATGAIATDVTNVVGDGLQLQAQIDHEALGVSAEQADKMEREQEREWALFCKSADFTRVQHFDPMQRLLYRARKESGDVFIVRRYRKDGGDIYGTKLQVLEADRVSNPNRAADNDKIAGGVEVDGDGVVQRYHFTDKHPGNINPKVLNWSSIPARTDEGVPLVLHLFDRTRPEQSRGIPGLAPVIELVQQLGTYTDAEVTAAVQQGFLTFSAETEADEDDNPPIGEKTPDLADNEVKLGQGAMISMAKGEKLVMHNPTRPNSNFDPFFISIVRQIGVALEIPFELLIKHFTASYSASRAALEVGYQYFRRERSAFSSDCNQIVYEWMMEEAVASGRLNRPGFFEDPIARMAYLGAEWNGWARPSINPKAEAEADEIDLRNNVKTREEICQQRTGGEFEKKAAQLKKESTLVVAQTQTPPQGQAGAPKPGDDQRGTDADDDETKAQRQSA